MIPKGKEFGIIIMTITREEIEQFDHEDQLKVLSELMETPNIYEGKINLYITGYDADSRALWEIKEVRDYFDFLDRCFPYWFFFLNRDLPKEINPLLLLTYILVPLHLLTSNNEKKNWEIDLDFLAEFANIHFYYFNEVTDKLEMPLDENKRISKEIMTLLWGSAEPLKADNQK
jgi:hypothetical protein